MQKPIDKQVDTKGPTPHEFAWEVKFYPPAPEILNEDLTRFVFFPYSRSPNYLSRGRGRGVEGGPSPDSLPWTCPVAVLALRISPVGAL